MSAAMKKQWKKPNPGRAERNPEDTTRDTFQCMVSHDIPEEEQIRLHCKSKTFNRLRSDEVATALKEAVAKHVSKNSANGTDVAANGADVGIDVPSENKITVDTKIVAANKDSVMIDVFKKKVWDFAFVGIKKEFTVEFKKLLEQSDIRITVKDATTRTVQPADKAAEQKRDRFGYKIGHVPTLMELKMKLANWGRQKNVALVDKTVPLYTQYSYATQLKMKHTYARTMCKGIVKKMKTDCDAQGFELPAWADVSKANHGIVTEQILACPKYLLESGYRNKCEFSCGVADCLNNADEVFPKDCNGTEFNVGFVQRAQASNEQVVGSPKDLPHIPIVAKKVAEIFKEMVKDSGLPIYSRDRERRTGFWRLLMCRVVDTIVKEECNKTECKTGETEKVSKSAAADPASKKSSTPASVPEHSEKSNSWLYDQRFDMSKIESQLENADQDQNRYVEPENQPVLLVFQTAECQDPAFMSAVQRLFEKHFLNRKDINVQSIYWLMNDGMSDAFETSTNLSPFTKDISSNESITDVVQRMLNSDNSEVSKTAEFIMGKRKNKYFSRGELIVESPSSKEAATENKDADKDVDIMNDDETRAEDGDASPSAYGSPDEYEEERTATGNLMRARTKNERKKKINVNVNPDQKFFHLVGPPNLQMPLCGLEFEVGPSSFFQVNSVVCQKLYTKALQWGQVIDPESPLCIGGIDLRKLGTSNCPSTSSSSSAPKKRLILDVCSGVGTIGCIAAKHADENTHVIGVELIPEAVASANKNADWNNLERCQWLAGKAEEVLPQLFEYIEKSRHAKSDADLAKIADEYYTCYAGEEMSLDGIAPGGENIKAAQTCRPNFPEIFKKLTGNSAAPIYDSISAIVDPPRVGLHKDVCRALRENQSIDKLVYISCNPDSLVEDVVKLGQPKSNNEETRFVPFKCVPVDMFPHTIHIEMIMYLERFNKRHEVIYNGDPTWFQRLKEGKRKTTEVTPSGNAVTSPAVVAGATAAEQIEADAKRDADAKRRRIEAQE